MCPPIHFLQCFAPPSMICSRRCFKASLHNICTALSIFLGLWNSIQTTYLLWQLHERISGNLNVLISSLDCGSQERNHPRCLFSHVACERKNQWCSCSPIGWSWNLHISASWSSQRQAAIESHENSQGWPVHYQCGREQQVVTSPCEPHHGSWRATTKR